jgi:vancomycin resistance protein YoaR
MYEQQAQTPHSAAHEFKGGEVSVIPGKTGKRVEQQQFIGSLESGLFGGTHGFEVPVADVAPELTTAKAQELKPTKLIGKYRTTFRVGGNDSPKRVDNLRTASNAINGTLLAPGEVFSANELLAPLDYNKTKVFLDGEVTKAAGGGLCQVASTLYMATNYAGLDAIERHPHYAELPYIRPGFDATLWFGGPRSQGLDYKFKNNSSGYVMVREYVRDGYIYAEIWGKPTGKKVKMDSKQVDSGSNSSKWVTHKKVKKDGEVLFDGKLHTDSYQGIKSIKGEMVSPSEVQTAPIRP